MHPGHGGRIKRLADDNEDPHSLVKKRKYGPQFDPVATIAEDSHLRPSRTGAGSGGRIAQLERIGAVLESSQKCNPRTTLADDVQPNPLAPASVESNAQKRVCMAHFSSIFQLLISS